MEGTMVRRVSATEARIHLGELTQEAVESREPILVERRGKSHVVILSADEYERLLQVRQQDDWLELVRQAREQIRMHLQGRTQPPPDEILEQSRQARDKRLLTQQ
jgi:prevent-host-death family protein